MSFWLHKASKDSSACSGVGKACELLLIHLTRKRGRASQKASSG